MKKMFLFLMLFGFSSMQSSWVVYQGERVEALGIVDFWGHPLNGVLERLDYLKKTVEDNELVKIPEQAFELTPEQMEFLKKTAPKEGVLMLYRRCLEIRQLLRSDRPIVQRDLIKAPQNGHPIPMIGQIIQVFLDRAKAENVKVSIKNIGAMVQILLAEQKFRTNIYSEFSVETYPLALPQSSLILKHQAIVEQEVLDIYKDCSLNYFDSSDDE